MTVNDYEGAEKSLDKTGRRSRRTNLKEIEDSISAQIDKAQRDEIANKYAQVDKEIKALETRKVPA